MPRFLIEVPHEGTKESCNRAVKVFLDTGSHFMTHADWGCDDGEHKAWFVLEIEDKEAARQVIPPAYRADAKITQLRKFKIEDIPEFTEAHTK